LLIFSLPMFSSGDLSRKKNWVGMEYWHGDPQQKKIALTFDDGPSAVYTEQVLNILAHYQVKATFFMVGENVAKYPQISRMVAQAGHSIENHSYSHPNMIFKSNKGVRREIDRAERIIQDATGTTPNLFRPPY
jgi:peptidoglycan-N-acetylglucosamine deacetylase